MTPEFQHALILIVSLSASITTLIVLVTQRGERERHIKYDRKNFERIRN